MTKGLSQMREIRSQIREKQMSFTFEAVRDEMRGHVRAVAALAQEDGCKSALSFASRVLGLPFWRVKKLYYGEANRIDAHEADQIRAYVQAAEKLIQARADYEAKRAQFLAEAHPALGRMVPPPLAGSADAETHPGAEVK